MKSFFHPRLVNDRFDDPSVFVEIPWEHRAVLLDLGLNYHLPPKKLLKVTDALVSHAHMDHFIGFDHLLRLRLPHDRPLRLFGPDGITTRVASKLAGYTWNVVDSYPFSLEVIEIVKRKDIDELFAAGEDLDKACEGCHLEYWYPGDRKAVEEDARQKARFEKAEKK